MTALRTTLGLPGRLSARPLPNHPKDDARGNAIAMLDGLLYGVAIIDGPVFRGATRGG